MKKIKVGMVGTGFIADWHYRGFKDNPDADMVGMCRIAHESGAASREKQEILRSRCQELGLQAYDSFEQMVEDPQIDALVIGSINPLHFEQIREAVAKGKHVLVEKPVVTDLDQLEELMQLSSQSGCQIFPAHNFVYREAVRQAKEILDTGGIGQRIHASFVVTHTIGEDHATGWRAKQNLAKGGTLIDSGHHLIYQTLYLLGRPTKLQGFTSKRVLTNMECEDTAQVSLAYDDGSIAVVMQSWASNHGDDINGIRIIGTEGSLVITDALYHNGEKLSDDVDYESSFKNQAKAFSDAILNGVAPRSSLEDVRDTLRITYGAYESNDEGRVIDL